MKPRTFRFSRLLSLLIATVPVLVPPAPAGAQIQPSLGGAPADGNLLIVAEPTGALSIQQFEPDGVGFTDRTSLNQGGFPERGSVLILGNEICSLGYQPPFSPLPVSHTMVSATEIETTIDCPNIGVEWTQRITYPGSGPLLQYRWSITNRTQGDLVDLRFFHAANLQLGSFDFGPGYVDTQNNVLGKFARVAGSMAYTAAFRPDAAPFAIQADDAGNIRRSIFFNGTLDNNVGPGDTAYALEWRAPTLGAGQTFVVEGRELFSFRTNAISISSPVFDRVTAGVAHVVSFLVVNRGPGNETIRDGQINISDPAWTAEIIDPAVPTVLAPDEARYVLVIVLPPGSSAIGDLVSLNLSFDTDGGPITESSFLTIDQVLPPIQMPSVTSPKRTTNSLRPLISGQTEPDATVTIDIDGVREGVVRSDRSGFFSLDLARDLTLGRHELMVIAQDQFQRTASLDVPFEFVITGGSPLDFDGDGLYDLTNYSASASRVAFRWLKSSDGTQVSTILPGRVPAPGDYNGDDKVEFATIARSDDNLVWNIAFKPGEITSEIFGNKGDSPFTGCIFKTPRQTSLALLSNRDRRVTARDVGDPATIEFTVPRGDIIGCIDFDLDGIDEVIVREDDGDGKVLGTVVTIAGEVRESISIPAFDRGFVTRGEATGTSGVFTSLRVISPTVRRASVLGAFPDSPSMPLSFDVPRKLVVSGGTRLDGAEMPRNQFIWQDLKTGQIFARELVPNVDPVQIGKISNRSLLVRPSYIYRTVKQR